ncbi:LuxR C-terminal-related transcriptional regulator [Streptomyces sp. NPDC056821]|uniref:helix-turn-helix transcriptional regulator n=2 Tax=Streptomyces TaxID=1883 RepID=UPI0036975DF8
MLAGEVLDLLVGEVVVLDIEVLRPVEQDHVGQAMRPLLALLVGEVPSPVRLDALNDRERETLVAIALGWTNSELAQRLALAESTVKTHVSRVPV